MAWTCIRKAFRSRSENFAGKVVMECVIETKASTILQLSTGCVEICKSRLKKALGLAGYTIC